MKILLILTILITLFSFRSSALVYYVDAKSGNDLYHGNSPTQAWKTIAKVNEMNFQPGDRIVFKSGTTYFGQLEVKGCGTADQPIVIDRYGEGSKPIIHGNGEKDYTVLIENTSYWEINNLEITNTGEVRRPKRTGILVKALNYGESHHIYLLNLTVHDVNGSLVKQDGGGSAIEWQNGGDSIPTRFIDLRIEGCHLYNCGRNGINSWGNTSRRKWFPSLNVIVRNNLLEGIPGDGIVPIGCSGALIEHNVMRDCPDILSHEEAAAGIWPWSSDSTIIQFNEVSNHRAKWDGQGFDSDYNCIGTVILYNYSHDNNGGFLLLCNDGNSKGKDWNQGTSNSIIRYNLSVNDGLRPYPTERSGWFSPVIHITGSTDNSLITENILVQCTKFNPQIDVTTIKMDSWGGWPVKTSIVKNTFIAEFDPRFSWGNDTQTVFENNKIVKTDSLEKKRLADYFHMAFDTTKTLSAEGQAFFEFIKSR